MEITKEVAKDYAIYQLLHALEEHLIVIAQKINDNVNAIESYSNLINQKNSELNLQYCKIDTDVMVAGLNSILRSIDDYVPFELSDNREYFDKYRDSKNDELIMNLLDMIVWDAENNSVVGMKEPIENRPKW